MSSNRKFKFQILPAYLICIAFATLLWFLTMLSKNYTTEVNVPVVFTDFPNNKIAKSELPGSISVAVNGRGFNLIKLQASFKENAIAFNVKELLHGTNSNIITINAQELRDRVGMQINPSLTVNAVHPETVSFSLAEVAQKSVPVKINSDISFKKLYTQKGSIFTTPSTITITGAHDAIDSIEYVTTDKIIKNDIFTNISESVKLVPIPNVIYSTNSVTLNIDTELSTGAERSVAISVINLPSAMRMTLFPENVKLTYEVGLSKYEESLQEDFRIVVDYNDVKGNGKFLEVTSVETPQYIKNLTISPIRVEYIIE